MLSLPGEVRCLILVETVASFTSVDIWNIDTIIPDLAIVQVCRQLYQEAMDIFFRFNRFVVSSTAHARQLAAMARDRIHLIRSIRLTHTTATVDHDLTHAWRRDEVMDKFITSTGLFRSLQSVELSLTVSSVCARLTSNLRRIECQHLQQRCERALISLARTNNQASSTDRGQLRLEETQTTGVCVRTLVVRVFEHGGIKLIWCDWIRNLLSSLVIQDSMVITTPGPGEAVSLIKHRRRGHVDWPVT